MTITKRNFNVTAKMVVLIVMAGWFNQASAQLSKIKFGKGFYVMANDSSMDMKFQFRFQTLFQADQTIDPDGKFVDDFESEILIRRARLKFQGFVYNPNLTYKVELGLSNKDIGWKKVDGNEANFYAASNIILDAVLKWQFAKNFSLWVGQTKLPGNRERVISSQQLQFVDRSILNSKFNLDRDIGIQLHHKAKLGKMVLKDAWAISQGEGRNHASGNDDGFAYTGRLELLPMGDFTDHGDYFGSDLAREPKPKLSIAANYQFNDEARRTADQLGSYVTVDSLVRDLQSVQADFMFKWNGFSMMGEYAKRSVAAKSPGAYVVGDAFNIQGGYLFKKNLEIAARFTQFRPSLYNSSDHTSFIGNKVEMYTLGLSKYIVGHSLKIQTDISETSVDNDDNRYMTFRFQVEMQF